MLLTLAVVWLYVWWCFSMLSMGLAEPLRTLGWPSSAMVTLLKSVVRRAERECARSRHLRLYLDLLYLQA